MNYHKCKFYNIEDKNIHPLSNDSKIESIGFVKFKCNDKISTIVLVPIYDKGYGVREIDDMAKSSEQENQPFIHLLMNKNKIVGMFNSISSCEMVENN